jgi:hypothetical protein
VQSQQPVPVFDNEFLDDLPYDPEVLFFNELLEVDPEKSLVRARMPTNRAIPFMDLQRVDPIRHPKHVAGAALIHATGMLGFVHAYYIAGLRHRDGWIGYGTNIHKASFRKLVPPGTPIDGTCRASKYRAGKNRHVARYEFEFRHEGDICYVGEQTAVWTNTLAHAGAQPGARGRPEEG